MTYATSTLNPFYAARLMPRSPSGAASIRYVPVPRPESQHEVYAKLPRAPKNASPVPRLTSLYHNGDAGNYGSRNYPGNCGGNLIKDLLRFFNPCTVIDPMTGSGTCRDVCKELGIYCWSSDLHEGIDACDAASFPRDCFDFAWLHPPYWRQKLYGDDPRCLSRTPTLDAFLERYRLLIATCTGTLVPGGRLAILMGDYVDRQRRLVPLTYYTKHLAFDQGLRQCAPDIVRFLHGVGSSHKTYPTSFIPTLHDVCMVFEKQS
jgi:hypothetical protein